jgi:uncharacterized protein with ParB-like and HNH nuclease domain
MEAKENKIQEILTENKMYFIPEYQRPYSWSIDNVSQLLDDLETSFINEEPEYFIGSMICIKKGNNFFEVVDGQQRLTTLSLVLVQLKKLINSQGIKDDLQKRVLPVDVFLERPTEPRLTVRRKEFNLYKFFILQDNKNYLPSKPTDTELLFIENSNFINEYLKDKDQALLKKLAQYILQNVFCVFVTTENFSSSFRLFNVLNNRGLPLSNSDLLKNSLFEYSEANKLNKIQVEENWQEIENLIGVRNFDKFLSLNKISEKKDRNRVTKQDYDSYLQTLKNDFKGDAVAMSISLLNSAKNYMKIIENDFSDFDDKNLERRTKTLSNLSNDEWVPPLMAYLNKVSNGSEKLEKENFSKFVEIFESVYLQGWIRKQIKSQREAVSYMALALINNDKNFSEIISGILNHSDGEEFKLALDLPIYEPRPNQVALLRSILLRIDMEMQDISVSKTYNGRVTIEHILPQKINNEYWRSEFSDEQHEFWVHRIGNLTLISGHKNSEAQNSDFNKKKLIYKKLNSRASFDITKDICDNDVWNIRVIEKRHNEFKKLMMQLWSTEKYQDGFH